MRQAKHVVRVRTHKPDGPTLYYMWEILAEEPRDHSVRHSTQNVRFACPHRRRSRIWVWLVAAPLGRVYAASVAVCALHPRAHDDGGPVAPSLSNPAPSLP